MQTTTENPPRTRRPEPTYNPGFSRSAVEFLSTRTLESHAAFLLPLLDRGLEVLDAGCGSGSITQGIAQAVMPGRVTGVDRDASQITRAGRLAEGLELMNARFVTAGVYDLPFERDSFDLVFSHALFERLSDPAAALAELRRVLRPGAQIALCSLDWDGFRMDKPTHEALAAIASYRTLLEANGVNTTAGGQLASWLEDGGFKIVREGRSFEEAESPMRVATRLAMQLDAAGDTGAARALLDWSTEPGAALRGCWRNVVAIKWNR